MRIIHFLSRKNIVSFDLTEKNIIEANYYTKRFFGKYPRHDNLEKHLLNLFNLTVFSWY